MYNTIIKNFYFNYLCKLVISEVCLKSQNIVIFYNKNRFMFNINCFFKSFFYLLIFYEWQIGTIKSFLLKDKTAHSANNFLNV